MRTLLLSLCVLSLFGADTLTTPTIQKWQREDRVRYEERMAKAYAWYDSMRFKPMTKKPGPNLTPEEVQRNTRIDSYNQLLITFDVERKANEKEPKPHQWQTVLGRVGDIEAARFALTGVRGPNPPE